MLVVRSRAYAEGRLAASSRCAWLQSLPSGAHAIDRLRGATTQIGRISPSHEKRRDHIAAALDVPASGRHICGRPVVDDLIPELPGGAERTPGMDDGHVDAPAGFEELRQPAPQSCRPKQSFGEDIPQLGLTVEDAFAQVRLDERALHEQLKGASRPNHRHLGMAFRQEALCFVEVPVDRLDDPDELSVGSQKDSELLFRATAPIKSWSRSFLPATSEACSRSSRSLPSTATT